MCSHFPYRRRRCCHHRAVAIAVVAVAIVTSVSVAVIVVIVVIVIVVGRVATPSLSSAVRPYRHLPSSSWGFSPRHHHTRTSLHVVITVMSVHPPVSSRMGIVILCGHCRQLFGATTMRFCQCRHDRFARPILTSGIAFESLGVPWTGVCVPADAVVMGRRVRFV